MATEVGDAVRQASVFPLRVELDLETGRRGGRDEGCAVLIRELTGCEAATVVNNNAAATLLTLAALARGKRVLVSHGELVEIGGSYRVPEIMTESGAVLVAVGTTNRTHVSDYRNAIDADTALILKVHTSNYRIFGFTNEVAIEELVALGREHKISVAHDLGSGLLLDLDPNLVRDEPKVRASLSAGADLVCFSGDKLLGGPQAGILAGTRDAIEKCRRHPLYRTMRPGRLVYAALEATLRIYREGEHEARSRIPTLNKLTIDESTLRRRANGFARQLKQLPEYETQLVSCDSQAGSGSLPARALPSWGVQVRPRSQSAEALATALRTGDPAVLCRISEGAVLFDVRTIDVAERHEIVHRLQAITKEAVS
jgi:L-seryl-tRNA(Ser) seleniumtransferase